MMQKNGFGLLVKGNTMKIKKVISIISIVFMTIGAAQTKGEIFYTVPFQNVEIKPASKIYVDYHFDAHRQVVVCKNTPENDAITSIEWIYKDATRKIELPVKLKDDMRVKDGYYADPEGRLVITNDFVSPSNNGSILVTCEYQKIN